ncbi:hypothetical protein [Cloacibacterium rupense]|uniref:hypothetical protein n=1 Tax=Cloacibacterium rupense TaxID=517423 RepID=UPI00166A1D9A|nr:hypothetical protein [Cloacibacterium rupense]
MKKILAFFFFLNFIFSFSQKIEKLPLRKFKIAILSDSLKETSGLTFLRDQLYTFNDSGNTNEIFEIDKNNGKILKKFKTNFPNKDWEAITNDGESLYIGDFGNNAGSRKDLAIYKTSPFCDNISSVDTDLKFQFNYSEQKDFIVNYLNHDFDAEAMIFLDGNIHLFTKEWASKNISHYIISVQSTENQTISKLESYETGFVVTDASYFEGKLYVVGYTKKAKVYLMVFEENQDGLFFSEPLKKYKLGSALTIGQVEGIAVNKDGIYISNERFVKLIFNAKQSLYFIPFHQLK